MQDLARDIAAQRPFLARFARRRLDNEAWADDAVSETVLAALARPAAFGGRAQLRTWLAGILEHKIADQLRRHLRERPFETFDDDDGDDGDALSDAAAQAGARHYAGWGDPFEGRVRREFMADLQRCLGELPERQGRAFVMRDALEAGTDEICSELGISANHLGVMLHRARRRLGEQLSQWRPR